MYGINTAGTEMPLSRCRISLKIAPNADLIEEVVDTLAGKSHNAIFGIIRQQTPYKHGLQNILDCEIQNKELKDFFAVA